MERRGIERRELFKRAGIGSAALASFPALAGAAWADDDDDDGSRRRFYFDALSGHAATLGGGETVVMTGCGSFTHDSVRGGGEFVHFDGTKIPSPAFIATGSWKATRVVSFDEIGTWGVAVAGVLELEIKLRPCDGPVIRGAMLKVVCNLSPAGIVTSPFQQEGFTLSVPGLAPFNPFTPNIGLTLFTRRCEELDEEEDED
ncbi:MAG: hypothetical protein ACRDN8_06145 [Thermoleophilaceae bacterium]